MVNWRVDGGVCQDSGLPALVSIRDPPPLSPPVGLRKLSSSLVTLL
jgi:hypothetical protein